MHDVLFAGSHQLSEYAACIFQKFKIEELIAGIFPAECVYNKQLSRFFRGRFAACACDFLVAGRAVW